MKNMKKQFEKNEHQMILFDLIRNLTPKNQILVDIISDTLNISTDAAYRRIRGEKLLDFSETIILCRQFKISLDALANITAGNDILCQYTPLDLRDTKNYLTYLQNFLNNIEGVRNGELFITAVDIPSYNCMAYKELTSFRLFTWSSSAYGFAAGYDEFVKQWDCDEASNYYEKIVKTYLQCPSTEIWTEYTIDQMLRFLKYHFEMGHFAEKKIPLLLCEQLLDMMNTIHIWTAKGSKGTKETPFKFYVSETDLNNNFHLFKKNGTTKSNIKLFTINHFHICDQRFCRETENWLQAAIQRSTLISGSSEKQRHKFFNGQREKINVLMNKIVSHFWSCIK
jgi:hypothetical protein